MIKLVEFFSIHTFQVEAEYDNYRYSSVLRRLAHFMEEFSALFLDPARDRLYCDPQDSLQRRSAQSLLHHALQVVSTFCERRGGRTLA